MSMAETSSILIIPPLHARIALHATDCLPCMHVPREDRVTFGTAFHRGHYLGVKSGGS